MKEHLNDGGKLSEQDFLHALESAIFFVSMSVYGFSINTLWIIYESEGHIARRLSFKENSKDFNTWGNNIRTFASSSDFKENSAS